MDLKLTLDCSFNILEVGARGAALPSEEVTENG